MRRWGDFVFEPNRERLGPPDSECTMWKRRTGSLYRGSGTRMWMRLPRIFWLGRAANVDPASIDLVVYGELQRRHEGGEEMFELKLRARDLLSQRDLAFHRTKPPGKTQVLADIYGTTGNLASWIGELASTVSTNIPRLQAGVFFARSHWYSLRRSEVRIDVSESDGAFEGMRLCFYAEGDPNRICAGEIVSVGNDFSVVKPERQHERLQDGVVAVTK
jgi:hypothetical protein